MNNYITIEQLDKLFGGESDTDFVPDEEILSLTHVLSIGPFYKTYVNKYTDKVNFSGVRVMGIKFYHCHFKSINFTAAFFWMCSFYECIFEGCNLERSVFRKNEIMKCVFLKCSSRFNWNISESYIYDTQFLKCRDLDGLEISGTDMVSCKFERCTLSGGLFQSVFTKRYLLSVTPKEYLTDADERLMKNKRIFNDLLFNDCFIEFTNFRNVEFMDVKFKTSELIKCAFIDSRLFEYNFDSLAKRLVSGSNFIDIDTLKKSERLSTDLLKNLFNLEKEIQEKIMQVAKSKQFINIFISYSLKDSPIALRINDILKANGFSTFLWENDALGGRTLKSIMKMGIEGSDRLLFIASENSLKSEACHFELTQGRKKQDQLWKTILFPIHIDSFLFKVEYDDVRPRLKRDEYWENISELRLINSLDFSDFDEMDDKMMEKKINNMITSLQGSS